MKPIVGRVPQKIYSSLKLTSISYNEFFVLV